MTEPFGIYIHWPFCEKKCPYCDFNSHVAGKDLSQRAYIEAFRQEMAYFYARVGRRVVTSIFFGGGTPSLMAGETCAEILQAIAHFWPIDPNAEISLEANPSSAEMTRFHLYRQAGVNRLSLGVQALEDAALQQLGRVHNKAQALAAIEMGQKIFPRFSFDLIYTRPQQSLEAWQKELKQALSFAPQHVSLYQLSIEKGTRFYALHKSGQLQIAMPEEAAEFYTLTQEITEQYGLPAYEISNYAQRENQSQHNLLYWRYKEYIGLGPGAHSRFLAKQIAAKKQEAPRIALMNEKKPEKWRQRLQQEGEAVKEEEYLTSSQQADEMLLMGLRLQEGLDIARYETLAKRSFSAYKLAHLQEEGLIEMVGNHRLRASRKGRLVLEYIIVNLAI